MKQHFFICNLAILLFSGASINFQKHALREGHAVYLYQAQSFRNSSECDLYFNEHHSLFVANPLVLENDPFTELMLAPGAKMVKLDKSERLDMGFLLYRDYESMNVHAEELVLDGKRKTVLDSLGTPSWVQHLETKMIAGLACEKATVSFRCSEYVAWFAPGVPVSAGPWKLGGLPGLIVELENVTNGEKWTLSRINSLTSDEAARIKLPERYATCTFKEFGDMQKAGLERIQKLTKITSIRQKECFD